MSNSVSANACNPLDVFDQVIIVFLMIDWSCSLNRYLVALVVTPGFGFGSQFEHERFEMLSLQEVVQRFRFIFKHIANFVGCFAYRIFRIELIKQHRISYQMNFET